MPGGGSIADSFIITEVPIDQDGDGRLEYEYGWNFNKYNYTVVNPRLVAGEKTGVILVAGESIASNSSPTQYTVTNTKVEMLNIYDGAIYACKDPMFSTTQGGAAVHSGTLIASPMTLYADFQRGLNTFSRIIIINISVGGSNCAQWAAGGIFNQRFNVAKARCDQLGLPITCTLWQQGYNDAFPGFASDSTAQVNYITNLQSVIDSINAITGNAKIFIAKQGNIPGYNDGDSSGATVKAIQQNRIDSNPANCLLGADTDAVPYDVSNRYDGLHLTQTGASAWALDWRAKVHAVFG